MSRRYKQLEEESVRKNYIKKERKDKILMEFNNNV
mgnify:CR=1 FL=1